MGDVLRFQQTREQRLNRLVALAKLRQVRRMHSLNVTANLGRLERLPEGRSLLRQSENLVTRLWLEKVREGTARMARESRIS